MFWGGVGGVAACIAIGRISGFGGRERSAGEAGQEAADADVKESFRCRNCNAVPEAAHLAQCLACEALQLSENSWTCGLSTQHALSLWTFCLI